jgi:predicted dinucleotide-binding enzyme
VTARTVASARVSRRPLDVGPLTRAQQLEQLGFLHISPQQPQNRNFGSEIKLHHAAKGA